MNATSAKALTAIKQKIKKATRDNEDILAEYKGVRVLARHESTYREPG